MSDSKEMQRIEDEELESRILERLETVIDPELGIDIVNIGLVYQVNVFENGFCEIQVTLTTIGCPFGDVIESDIINALRPIPEITETKVKFVWYPAWNPSRMTRYARIALGMR